MKLVRRLRIIEYVGTPEFVNTCIEKRQVKGCHVVRDGSIREAFIGETNEVLLEGEIAAIEEARKGEAGI